MASLLVFDALVLLAGLAARITRIQQIEQMLILD